MTFSTLSTPSGTIELEPVSSCRTRVTLKPTAEASLEFIPRLTCETSYPEEVPVFLEHGTSFHWLCDSIARFEDPDYVLGSIRRQLFAFVTSRELPGTRILDFGCGPGASTVGLATLLPASQIVGVEPDAELVRLAGRLAAKRQLSNVEFRISPAGGALPQDLGSFDYVMLSAVFEHLLPSERRMLIPQLWDLLKPGGILFINQTPHRWFPRDAHSTGLWGINYLPDKIAHSYARRFSSMNPSINRSLDWNVHLRGGLRGGSEQELIRLLSGGGRASAIIMQPVAHGLRDRADYWLSCTSPRLRPVKKAVASLYRLTDRLFGTIPAVNLDLALRKASPRRRNDARRADERFSRDVRGDGERATQRGVVKLPAHDQGGIALDHRAGRNAEGHERAGKDRGTIAHGE